MMMSFSIALKTISQSIAAFRKGMKLVVNILILRIISVVMDLKKCWSQTLYTTNGLVFSPSISRKNLN